MAVEPAYRRPPEPIPASMSETVRQSRLDGDTLDTLAWTMLGEAANQGTDGMAAIAHVILNRAESGRYPSDPKSVALQNKQFSTWNSGQGGNNPKQRFPKTSPAFKQARQIAAQVLSGSIPDPTGGATHYWAPKGMTAMGYDETPYWADSERTRWGEVKLGDHIFLARQPVPPGGIANPPVPATQTASLQSLRNSSDVGEGASFDMFSRFRNPGAPATMSAAALRDTGRIQDVPMPRARPSLPTPIADAANITPMTFPPSPTAALSRGIVDSAQSPKLFAEGVGIPNDQIPGTDATYSGGNRMSTGGLGALLGRSFSPATPNPTPWQPTVAGRPSVPGSLPAARPQSTITGRPDAPVGSMPAKRASAPVPAPWGQRPGSSAQAGPMETSSVRPLATQPTSNPSFAAPLPPKYITKTVQTANPDYRQVNPGNPTLAAMGFSPGTMPASAQVPQYLTKTVKAPNPAYQSALLAQQRALRAAPVPATQSAAMAASRVPAPMDTGLFGVPMSSGMKTALATPSKSSGSSSSSSSKSVPAGYKDLGGGKFQSASGGIYYTRHL